MVLAHRLGPRAEPPGQRLNELSASSGVSSHNRELFFAQLTLLVEELGGDGQLADVVEEAGPVKQVAVVL
jgi:hypothetical protein